MTEREIRAEFARAELRGIASLIDPTVLRMPGGRENGFARDAQALAGDWAAVGHDIRKAIQTAAPRCGEPHP